MKKILNLIIKYCLYLLVFLLPLFFLPFSFEAFEYSKQYLLVLFSSLAFLAWIFRMVVYDREIKLRRTKLNFPVLLFLAVAVLSVFFSVDTFSSILGTYGRFSDGLMGILGLGMFYFVLVNNVGISPETRNSKLETQEEEKNKGEVGSLLDANKLLTTFLFSTGLIVLVSYFSIFGLWSKLENSLFGGKGLPQIMMLKTFNPVAGSMEGLAMFLAPMMILAIGLLLQSSKKITIIFYWLFLVLSLILLLLIDFTPAWIVLGTVSVLFFAAAFFKKVCRERINFLLLPLGIVIISLVGIFFRFSGMLNLSQEVILSQRISWEVSFTALKDNPILGSGIGTYYYDFLKFKPADFNQTQFWNIRFDRSGNYISELLAQEGTVGILSYILIIGAILLVFGSKSKAGEEKKIESPQKRSGKRVPIIDLEASHNFRKNLEKGRIMERITKENVPAVSEEVKGKFSFSIFLVLLPLIALIASQFIYYQNTILVFSFWLFLGLSPIYNRRDEPCRIISLKTSPEKNLVLNFLLIVSIILTLGIYYAGARFYIADARYAKAVQQNASDLTGRIGLIEKAVNLNHHIPQYRITLGSVYLKQALDEIQKPTSEINQTLLQNDVSKAIEEVRAATDVAENNLLAWEARGVVYREIRGLAVGAEKWAIEAFEKAVELEPASPVLRTELGKLYLTQSKTGLEEEKESYVKKAREEFEEAIKLKPDYLDANIQLGLWEESQGNIKEAISKMEKLKASFPAASLQEVMFQLGRLYYNDNQLDKAIVELEGVVGLNPLHSNAHYILGIVYQKKGEKQKALKEFEKVLELNPDSQDVQLKIEEIKK